MSDAFDPYQQWLGIGPQEQPPHHYRLLGLRVFENDPRVINEAADRRMAQLRTAQIGRRAELSQRLLNEVAAARTCLMHPQRRAEYDAQLKRHFGEQPIHAAPSAPLNAEQPLPSPAEVPLSSSLPSLEPLAELDPAALTPLEAEDPLAGDAAAHPGARHDPLSAYPGYGAASAAARPDLGALSRSMTRVVWLAALVVLALATGLTFLLALVILISARQQDAPPEVAADVAASSSRPSARGSRGAGSAPAPAASTGSAAAASTSAPPAPPSRWRVVELQAADSEPVIPPPAQSSSDSLPPLRAIALPGWGDNSSRGSREMIIRLDFSHDGTRLASRNDRGDGLIWNVALAKSFNHFGYSGHYGHTHNWSPVDNFIVHSSTHRLAVRGERDARDLWLEWIPEVYGVAYSADGKEILAGARTLWSIPSDGGQLQELYTSDGASVNEIEVSVDGKVIAAVGGGGAPFLRFLFAKGHHEPIESLTPQAPVKEAKWSTDGKYFAYRTLRYVYVVSRQTGRTVAKFAVPRGRTDTFDFLHGGEIFVHKGDGLECRDVETGQLRLKLDTAMVVTCLAVAPDGETLAAASFGDIYIWRIPRETAVESPSP